MNIKNITVMYALELRKTITSGVHEWNKVFSVGLWDLILLHQMNIKNITVMYALELRKTITSGVHEWNKVFSVGLWDLILLHQMNIKNITVMYALELRKTITSGVHEWNKVYYTIKEMSFFVYYAQNYTVIKICRSRHYWRQKINLFRFHFVSVWCCSAFLCVNA